MFDRTDAFAIDANGVLCQSRDPNGWHGARATRGVRNAGKCFMLLIAVLYTRLLLYVQW